MNRGRSPVHAGSMNRVKDREHEQGYVPCSCLARFLLLAIRNRLVDKLVERCALLGGADGSHDWIPYDVAILIDDIRCREREQI